MNFTSDIFSQQLASTLGKVRSLALGEKETTWSVQEQMQLGGGHCGKGGDSLETCSEIKEGAS